MGPLTIQELRKIAKLRGIAYRPIKSSNRLIVKTQMSKAFPIPQRTFFNSFSDPVNHVGLFSIIKGATIPIRKGIEKLLKPNQFIVFEHVQESNLPPRLMLLKYTLNPPFKITKQAVTDPFLNDGQGLSDRKFGLVEMEFKKVAKNKTTIITKSTFHAKTGSVFARGFIDKVWLNFYERMMVANGEITEDDMQT